MKNVLHIKQRKVPKVLNNKIDLGQIIDMPVYKDGFVICSGDDYQQEPQIFDTFDEAVISAVKPRLLIKDKLSPNMACYFVRSPFIIEQIKYRIDLEVE